MTAPVLYLPRNRQGRDFVVGDIHGCFSLVDEALAQVNFDPAHDRLICAGDLIDRGPESRNVVDFLKRPYVYAVAGNHERTFTQLPPSMLRAMAETGAWCDDWGIDWASNLTDEVILSIQECLNNLPTAIEVPGAYGLIGIVHAGTPPGMTWREVTAALEHGDEYVTEYVLDSRQRLQKDLREEVPGVNRVYVGHTIVRSGPWRWANTIAMDTGAYCSTITQAPGYGLAIAATSLPLDLIPHAPPNLFHGATPAGQDDQADQFEETIWLDGRNGSSCSRGPASSPMSTR